LVVAVRLAQWILPSMFILPFAPILAFVWIFLSTFKNPDIFTFSLNIDVLATFNVLCIAVALTTFNVPSIFVLLATFNVLCIAVALSTSNVPSIFVLFLTFNVPFIFALALAERLAHWILPSMFILPFAPILAFVWIFLSTFKNPDKFVLLRTVKLLWTKVFDKEIRSAPASIFCLAFI
jgi:hypothetical protein